MVPKDASASKRQISFCVLATEIQLYRNRSLIWTVLLRSKLCTRYFGRNMVAESWSNHSNLSCMSVTHNTDTSLKLLKSDNICEFSQKFHLHIFASLSDSYEVKSHTPLLCFLCVTDRSGQW